MKKLIIIFNLLTIFAFSLNIKDAYLKSYNYEKMGSYSDAIKVLIPVNKKYPNSYTVNLRLGWLFFLNKRYKNAIQHYKKALLAIPSSIEANLGLIKCYLANEDLKNAIKIGGIILKIDYYNYYGNYYLSLALIRNKDYAIALNLVNKMLSLYPTSVLFLEELAKIKSVEKPQEAKKIYRNILILDPNNINAKDALQE